MRRLLRAGVDAILKPKGYSLIKSSLNPILAEFELKMRLDYILSYHILRCNDFFFIQIGAFDGASFDPICKFVKQFQWKGILIEPQAAYFAQLLRTYAREQEHLVFENCAVGTEDGYKVLYKIDPKATHLPKWMAGMASFNPSIIRKLKHQFPDIERYIMTETVPCKRFDTIISNHGVTKIDLLQIDTEGSDVDILSSIELEQVRPTIIHYESKHASTLVQKEMVQKLASFGYLISTNGHDTIAYLDEGDGA
jgi:FkbM family methyltransferase